MDLSNKPKFSLIFLSFLFLIALAPLSSSELKIGSSANVRGVVLGQTPTDGPCSNCNSSFNQTLADLLYWRLDGSNDPPTNDWNMETKTFEWRLPGTGGSNGLFWFINSNINTFSINYVQGGLMKFISYNGVNPSFETSDSSYLDLMVEGNVSANQTLKSYADRWCNATNCYSLSNFLIDTQGGGNPFDQVLNTTSNVTFNNVSAKNVNAAGNITGGDRLYVGGSPVSAESGDPIVYIQTNSAQAFALNGTQPDTTFFQGRTPNGLMALTENVLSFAFGSSFDNSVSGVALISTGLGGNFYHSQTASGGTHMKYGVDGSGSQPEDIFQAESASAGTNALGANVTWKTGNATGNGSSYYNIFTTRPGQGQGTTQRASELTVNFNANASYIYSNLSLGDRMYLTGTNLYLKRMDATTYGIFNSTNSVVIAYNGTNSASRNVLIPMLAKGATAYVCVNTDGYLYSDVTNCAISP